VRGAAVHHFRGMDAEKLLRDLIALPSVNPAFLPAGDARAGEARVADYLAALAGKAGLTVEFQEVFPGRRNLLARLEARGKARRRILLAPHLDTVGAEDFEPRVSNGRIFGRGACDTKGSVAAMFSALLQFARTQGALPETEILFAGLVDEENAQEGSRALAASGLKADLAVVGEPTELKVITAHKGDLWLRLVTRGKAAHGARPELGVNAVHEMARVIDLLETKYARELRKRRHKVLGRPTVNVGAVRGGKQPNIVPDYCEIDIDRRTIPGEKDPAVQREIVRFIREAGLKAELLNTKHNSCAAMETRTDLPLVSAFMKTAGQRVPLGVDFFCDAAILADAGVPCVVFGPGNIAQAHTANEWVAIPSLRGATELLLRFFKTLS
jgi:acetylornithine deacetylase/succinyl-diaminopimelate desuccinylase family protein